METHNGTSKDSSQRDSSQEDPSHLPRGGYIIWGAGRAEAGGCPGASCLSHTTCTQVLQLPQPSCPSLPVGTGQGAPSHRAMHSSKHSCPLLGALCRKPLTQPSASCSSHLTSHSRAAAAPQQGFHTEPLPCPSRSIIPEGQNSKG